MKPSQRAVNKPTDFFKKHKNGTKESPFEKCFVYEKLFQEQKPTLIRKNFKYGFIGSIGCEEGRKEHGYSIGRGKFLGRKRQAGRGDNVGKWAPVRSDNFWKRQQAHFFR